MMERWSLFRKRPELARPTGNVMRVLSRLGGDFRNDVVLISGRDRATLEDWFGSLSIDLVAEHGAYIGEQGKDWRMPKPLASDWKSKLLPVLETYAGRLPGAFVEKKEFCLVWHYRGADEEQGALTARELTDDLHAFAGEIDVQILPGRKVVEVRNRGVNKGAAVQQWLSKRKFDFVLAMGDDWTDEDAFLVLPAMAYSVRIGNGCTHARFRLGSFVEAVSLLEELIRKDRMAIWKVSVPQTSRG